MLDFFLIINSILFAINIICIVRRISLLRNKTKNTMYYSKWIFGFALITYLGYVFAYVFCYICFCNGKTVGGILACIVLFSFFLICEILCTILLYYGSNTYIQFNMTYLPIKKKSLDFEKSYILIHKPFHKEEKIVVSEIDIKLSEEIFVLSKPSKIFHYMTIWDSKHYLSVKLKDGSTRKINMSDILYLETTIASHEFSSLLKKAKNRNYKA